MFGGKFPGKGIMSGYIKKKVGRYKRRGKEKKNIVVGKDKEKEIEYLYVGERDKSQSNRVN